MFHLLLNISRYPVCSQKQQFRLFLLLYLNANTGVASLSVVHCLLLTVPHPSRSSAHMSDRFKGSGLGFMLAHNPEVHDISIDDLGVAITCCMLDTAAMLAYTAMNN